MSAPELTASLERLYRRNLHTIKLGLGPIEALLAGLDRPQDQFLAIHVAGTNGKGSVCALLEAILRAAGLRTGLYTSPHLVRFNERIRVNGEAISDADLVARMEDVERAVAAMRKRTGERDVTFFEFTTALAFAHFRRAGVQLAVIETGMGGRLDATNVLTPAVSVITSIGLDHQQFLGDTLAAIAGEKAGILKEGRPVVLGALPDEAAAVVARRATALGCPLVTATDVVSVRRTRQDWAGQRVHVETSESPLGSVKLPLLGDHQLVNLSVAVAVIDELRRELQLPISDEAMKAGIAAVRWPGRCQVLETEPPVLLDGAHNPEAAEQLAATLRSIDKRRKWQAVAGFLGDKDVPGIVSPLAGSLASLRVVTLDSDRALPAADAIARLPAAVRRRAEASELADALAAARADAVADPGTGVLIFGSLYLVGEVLKRQ